MIKFEDFYLKIIVLGALSLLVIFGGNVGFAQHKSRENLTETTNNQSAILNRLTIEIIPAGAGSVTKTPNKDDYDPGEKVKLQANSSSGYSFLHWSGDVDRRVANPLNIYMEENRTIAANFVISDPDNISKPDRPDGPSNANTGQVLTFSSGGSTSNLGGSIEYIFDWGDGFISEWSSATQTHAYGESGTYDVRVRARSTNDDYRVSDWSGTKSVRVTGPDKHILTIKIEPEDAGEVDIDPVKEGYDDGDVVTLRAISYSGYRFDRWTEGLKSTSNPVNIYMLKNRTIVANFISDGGGGDENVSIPDTPEGPSSGEPLQELAYHTGGSTSNLGHNVEYQFDFGDGNYSGWGAAEATHSYENTGSYEVRARARCSVHTDIVSGWSDTKTVTISNSEDYYQLTLLAEPENGGAIEKNPDKEFYQDNEVVEIHAIPNANFRFDHWSGDISYQTHNPINIYMRRDRTIIANFIYEGGELVTTPQKPEGPVEGNTGETLTYMTGGSTSNLGHDVEYQFDWGDGNQSVWGDSVQEHAYGEAGIYYIKARARCQIDNEVMSDWSDSLEVVISGFSISYTLTVGVTPENAGVVQINPIKETYQQDEAVQLVAIPINGNGTLDGNIYIEAETGFLFGNFGVEFDTTASGDYYLYGTQGNPRDGSAQYTFNIDESGNYYIWGRCYALSNTEDSFFILMDQNGDTLTWHLETEYYKWKWQRVTHLSNEYQFQLEVGEHTLTVIKRDINARLDKLIVTQDENFIPKEKAEIPPPETIYYFDHWSGDLSGTENPAEVIMNCDKNITANFLIEGEEIVSPPTYLTGPDSGYVGENLTFETGGAMSNLGNEVAYQFDWGDGSQSLWGISSRGHSFSSVDTFYIKSRARSQTDTTVISDWSSQHQVVIKEEPVATYTLTVFADPDGAGTITKLPDKPEYSPGDTVQLSASPAERYQFDHWSGDVESAINPILVIMDNNKSITAHFSEIQEVVNVPTTPTGPDSGLIGQALTFSTNGSACNFGHPVEYQFDWGDSTLSDWGANVRQHTFSYSDTMEIKARARCKVNPEVISDWSGVHKIYIARSFSYFLNITVDPVGSGSVNRTPFKEMYENGETVILSPLPTEGYIFDYWSGDFVGYDNPAFITIDGNKEITAHFKVLSGVEGRGNKIPDDFALSQNFPNPFNPETMIQYQLPQRSYVNLVIYNMQGQVVEVLVNEYKEAGYHSITWQGIDNMGNRVPSGIYVYRLTAGRFEQIRKMLLIK